MVATFEGGPPPCLFLRRHRLNNIPARLCSQLTDTSRSADLLHHLHHLRRSGRPMERHPRLCKVVNCLLRQNRLLDTTTSSQGFLKFLVHHRSGDRIPVRHDHRTQISRERIGEMPLVRT